MTTKHVATCPECGQRWHCWAERTPCDCPECVARAVTRGQSVWRDLGIDTRIGSLTFAPVEPDDA